MTYQMQIKIMDPANPSKMIWSSVKPSHTPTPYEYKTKEEAENMLRMCYGAALETSHMRVIESKEL